MYTRRITTDASSIMSTQIRSSEHCVGILAVLFVSMAIGGQRADACTESPIYVFNCSSERHFGVPQLASSAIEIDLSLNYLKSVFNYSFQTVRSLRVLYLKNNIISSIEPNSFAGLVHLHTLDLSTNRLRNITNDIFRELPSLQVLNLANNSIVTIHQHSFFSLASLKELILTANNLNCQCGEQLMKENIQYRNSQSPFKVNVKGPLCSNYDNQELFNIDMHTCTRGESYWESSVNCYSCANVPGLVTCGTNGIANCGKNTDVCYSTITYNSNRLWVTAGCMDYIACLDLIAKNNRTCVQGDTICSSCYLGSLSNTKDTARYTNEFVLNVTLEIRANLTEALNNVYSNEYAIFTRNIEIEVKNFLLDEKAGFWVEFSKLSTPQVTVHLNIHCTTIWYITTDTVIKALFAKLPQIILNGLKVAKVNIAYSSDKSDFCPPVVEKTVDRGTFNWPLTQVSTSATIKCPFQFNGSLSTATKFCQSGKEWTNSSIALCPLEDEQSRDLQQLSQTSITEENVGDVSSVLSTITSRWDSFTSTDIVMAVETVDKILNTDTSSTNDGVIGNTVDTINNLLNVGDDVLVKSEASSQSSTRLIRAVDKLLSRIEKDFTAVKSNLAGFVSAGSTGAFSGYTLSFNDGIKDLTKSGIDVSKSAVDIGAGMSGIVLPKTMLNIAAKVTLNIYSDPKLFKSISNQTKTEPSSNAISDTNTYTGVERKINSKVIAASVPERVITNLREPVKIRLNHEKKGKNVSCVFWSLTTSEWRSDGCSVYTTNEVYTECHCDHLTNFALLMDVYDVGGELSESNKLALRIISIVGCGLSLAGALLTLIIYAIFSSSRHIPVTSSTRLRRDNPSKILMQLCAAIAAVNLVFLVGAQEYSANNIGGCKTVAVLLHYFLLVIMCWMLVEAFYMYQSLVKVFDTYIARFQLKAAVFSWGTPLIIVVATLAVNKTDNYGYRPGGICWLERIPFYAAFLAPVCLVFVLNVITYVLVMKQIFRRSSSKLTKTEHSKTGARLRGAASLLVLLGLTWSFAILAIGDAGIAFLYLFVICNSLQGFFIFMFFCILKEDVRKAIKSVLPCLKSPYQTTSSTNDSSGTSMAQTTSSNATATNQSERTSANAQNQQEKKKPKYEVDTSKTTAFRGNWQVEISDKPNNSSSA
ncbi:adhesion G-protein coupled receptor G6-like isoform X2 [Dreissena polymorpha]|uniref:adhesion G-protein coupled receptor G6-like isoform X2 n=1 Tax=Dreissena polymorpha TaxID=45954 RepID=UPI0022645DF3|nr:adhesion G-protein coupled receptor G6-like isoform X2 [Dreissena polymorpha]